MQILILFIAFASTASLASASDLKNYLFDMGAADSKVASGYIRVTPDDVYTAKRGYGFTSRVSGAVESAEAFSRFGALLTDGVGGRYGRRDYAREGLVFRVDVPAGYYMAEVGVPDGPDARSLQVYVNGVFAARTRDNPMRQRGWDQTPPALLRFPVSVSGDSVLIRVEGVGSGKLYESQRVGLMSVALRPGYPHLFQRVGGRLEAVDPVFALEPDLQQGIARYDRGDFEGAASAFRKADVAPLVKAELLLWTAGHVSCPNHRALIEEALGLLKKDTADVRTQNRVRDIFTYLEGLDRVEARNWSWAREKFGMGQSSRLWYAQVHLRLVAGDPGDPLRFRALYALGQVYFGYFMELHDVRFLEASDEIFWELREAFLEDQMIRMYLGERFAYDDPKYTEGAEDAPIWATKQREALKRLLDVIHYWTDERQAENGEMGGHYEDDCEMFRHWQPALFAADDARAIRAIRRMADGVWDSDLIADGYSKRAYDVEHSSELISDTHPILLAAEYGNPEYVERAMATARVMRDVWVGKTERGNLHFRSMRIGAHEVDERAPYNVDVPYNARAVKPIRWLAWYNRHPEAVRLISEWGKSWIEAIAREADGKPAGVIPAAITFPENKLSGPGDTWYDTGMGWLYSFPSASGMIYDHLLAVWWITGDEAFLQPHRDGLAVLENLDDLPADAEIGSRAWALREVLNPGRFSSYRLLTGDARYDALFREGGSSYLRWRLTGDVSYLVSGCESSINSMRINRPFLTSEVYFTDRVFVRGAEHLLAMYTGDVTRAGDFPSFAVTWKNTGADFAALVTEGTDEALSVLVYNFEAGERTVGMRLWHLRDGVYSVVGKMGQVDVFRRDGVRVRRGTEVEVNLSSRQLTRISIDLTGEVQEVAEYLPDAGISARDVVVDGDRVRVTVHNIGTVDVENLTVALYDGEKALGRRVIQNLEAPLDLLPRTKQVVFALGSGMPDAVTVVLDPGEKLEEITRVNNRVTVNVNR